MIQFITKVTVFWMQTLIVLKFCIMLQGKVAKIIHNFRSILHMTVVGCGKTLEIIFGRESE